MLVKKDGRMWSTGIEPDIDIHGAKFMQVFSSGVVAAAAGNHNSIVLKRDGSVMMPVKDSQGQFYFFDGFAISKRTFTVVQTIPHAYSVATGAYHSMALTHGGYVWAMGWNQYGHLGAHEKLSEKEKKVILE